jgi:hypothetical protein
MTLNFEIFLAVIELYSAFFIQKKWDENMFKEMFTMIV